MTERLLHQVPPRCPSAYLLPGDIPISCKLSAGHDGLHRDDVYRWVVETVQSEEEK